MNVIFSTQGSNLKFFLDILQLMPDAFEHAGFYTSHARSFKAISKQFPFLRFAPVLKEWEIVDLARKNPAPVSYGDFNREAAIADRRLTFGWKCTYTDDPEPRFDEVFIQSILSTAQKEIESFWNKLKPDLLVGFVPVTFGEYLLFKQAEKTGVPTLILRSVRIENYQALHDRLLGLSDHFRALYTNGKFDDKTLAKARAILETIQKQGLVYEGTLKRKEKSFNFEKIKKNSLRFIKETIYALKVEIENLFNPVFRNDHHDPSGVVMWFYAWIRTPLRGLIQNNKLKKNSRYADRLDKISPPFAFFPLHFEPEVALQVYAQNYVKKQLSLIRQIAASLPPGMRLVVKDHPRAAGYRHYSFYDELLNIPNVILADAALRAASIIQKADLIAIISGTIGLEAALCGKPVITFGHTEYAALPDHMVRFCANPLDLPGFIQNHLQNYRYDEKSCLDYISALIKGSMRMDYYSLMLKKPGRNNFVNDDHEKARLSQLGDFTSYFRERISQVKGAQGKSAKAK
ncbi:MAG: hypothetical protein DYH13_07960 [Alphaproteobacteria bacterium PRO2]|nr:hypothetical protein [Alphaproteobacteria bacterium PRO2]